ncbi:hypothetical protein Hanom_Chr00s000003g01603051 [Helianthus anomalus]
MISLVDFAIFPFIKYCQVIMLFYKDIIKKKIINIITPRYQISLEISACMFKSDEVIQR